jgi:diacylglycerol kinase (ATP)
MAGVGSPSARRSPAGTGTLQPVESAGVSLARRRAGRSLRPRPPPRSLNPSMADSRDSLVPRGPQGMWRALQWSLKGLGAAFRLESSFRLEVYLFAVLCPIGLWLGQDGLERALLVGCLLLVLSAELLNSAIEAAVDRMGPEHNEFAGRAKDMGSAAVFVLMLNVILVWALLLLPRALA